ncbi:ABC-type transport auxiliary lipoprotein family protein [Ovoidimarina sediminis]|uniref:ABC-type transport auxiliary lipoprotein family protein n=1 Tax=Ovoidimarina sediminis TaxID=3079856 RepID=UPI0029118777|nr:ABC-type transport auxiliary lipoprotein family protein [Rhodophyticola sp. MJ-SS7]MDU8942194.1 ABC-type transport auxiliary lipoprotein family protein [Rhodophyticola sp. MJ-SS7]
MRHRLSTPAACLSGLLLLSGCSGLATLAEVATPSELYMLSPKSTFGANLPRLTQQIVVEEPTATAAVSTDRIMVQPSPLRVQYFPDVRWVDRAPVIVQTLLIESYENSGKVAAVGRSTVSLRADYLIVTDIREFHARVMSPDEPKTSPLEVQVRLNMKVIDASFDRIIASRSFEEFMVSQSDEIDDVIEAFDEALGKAMRDLVEWSVREISAHARRPDPEG